jgi:hypothetical protein
MLLTSLLNFSELLAYVIEFQVNTSNYLIVSGCYMSEIYFTSRQATVTSVTPSKYHNRDLSEVSVECVEVQNWLQGPFGFKSGNRSNSGGDPHWKLWTERPEYDFSMFMHIKYKTFLIFYEVTLNLIMYSSQINQQICNHVVLDPPFSQLWACKRTELGFFIYISLTISHQSQKISFEQWVKNHKDGSNQRLKRDEAIDRNQDKKAMAADIWYLLQNFGGQ